MNETGYESGNDDIVAEGDLALLQDDATAAVWSSWGASWRDVIIVDADNVPVYTYNLTTYSLSDPANYAQLKAILVAAAEGTTLPTP